MKYFAFIVLFALTTANAAELKFKKVAAKVGAQDLTVELADDDAKREHGLMFRKVLNDDQGMLFVFDDTTTRSFWMKNTLIPLDIGYFDQKNVLIDIQKMEPASPMDQHPAIYTSKGPAKSALEVPAGWFGRHHIELKSKLAITRP